MGKLDIVFANAGVAKYAPFGTITKEFYDSIFDTNVKGHGTEGAPAAARWRLDHPQRVHRRQQGVADE
jgi:NAD(P)-dependent dehydrogenase (short-subunit alcohol dehydrogenase family)